MELKVRNITLNQGKPKICVPLVGVDVQEVVNEIKDLKGLQYDLVEWRLDYFQDHSSIISDSYQVREALNDTVLLGTCRTSREGGNWDIQEDEYLDLLKKMVDSQNFDIIDVEAYFNEDIVNEVVKYAHDNHVRVILSYHDFTSTPSEEEIVSRLQYMADHNADICKIACMPQNKEDVIHLLNATKQASTLIKQPLCTMSMGQLGVTSRMVGELFASSMTFGCNTNSSAPGQIFANQLNAILDLIHVKH